MVAIKEWLEESGTPGTIRFYGTPAEEGGSGKVYIARDGYFDDVDIVLHWHPASGNSADAQSSNSNKSGNLPSVVSLLMQQVLLKKEGLH